jgi:sulfite exporter TauE/SafE
MALSGGLILALTASNEARLTRLHQVPGRWQRLRPHLAFNAGRVVGFAALGALLGAVGGTFVMPTWLVAALMLLAAVVLGLVGLRLTEISPRLAGWTLHLPAGWSRRLRLDEKARRGYSDGRASLLGASTFFLPCGFTQAAAVFALSTGSTTYAAAIMGVFALGTAPGLLTLGGLPSLITGTARTAVLRSLGVLVIAFALLNGAAGLRVLGIDPLRPFSNGGHVSATTVTDNVELAEGWQILHTQQFTDGYDPVHSVVYAGLPIRWVVDALDPQSCSSSIRAPSLGVAATLSLGLNVFEVPAQEPGVIRFSCSMGMTGGDITVIPGPSTSPEAP